MDKRYDMIVIGAGISGLAMAFEAKQAGLNVLVLEKEARCGGCFDSAVVENAQQAFWVEMGTHTCFNSYARLLSILDRLDLMDQLQAREKLRYRLLVDGSLHSIPARLHFIELMTHAWRIFSLKKQNQSVADYYGALVGPKNYTELFQHALSAVVCQDVNNVPADMLFRKRPRDKSIMRSYTFSGGLQDIIQALEQQLDIHTSQHITSITNDESGYAITTADACYHSDRLVCATPALAASRLLKQAHPEIAGQLNWVREVEVESVAVVMQKSTLSQKPIAGLIAVDGDFYSAVSRDYIEHPTLRGFTFHFKPGLLSEQEKVERICTALQISSSDIQQLFHKTNRLPAPDMGHYQLIEALDASLANTQLALIGNYFKGVAVEDCLERVETEFHRITPSV